jgi:hypothetical protein
MFADVAWSEAGIGAGGDVHRGTAVSGGHGCAGRRPSGGSGSPAGSVAAERACVRRRCTRGQAVRTPPRPGSSPAARPRSVDPTCHSPPSRPQRMLVVDGLLGHAQRAGDVAAGVGGAGDGLVPAPGGHAAAAGDVPEIGAHRDFITGMLKAGVTQATIHQLLRDEHGLTASVASLKRYVATNLPEEVRPAPSCSAPASRDAAGVPKRRPGVIDDVAVARRKLIARASAWRDPGSGRQPAWARASLPRHRPAGGRVCEVQGSSGSGRSVGYGLASSSSTSELSTSHSSARRGRRGRRTRPVADADTPRAARS